MTPGEPVATRKTKATARSSGAMTRAEVEAVLDELVTGEKPLSKLLTTPARMRRFFARVLEEPDLARQLDLVQQSSAHKMASEILDIADNEPDPQRARVRCEMRLKLLEKLNPGRFGQKIDVTHHERIDLVGILDRRLAKIDAEKVMPAVPVSVAHAASEELAAAPLPARPRLSALPTEPEPDSPAYRGHLIDKAEQARRS